MLYRVESNGKIKVESKEERNRRLADMAVAHRQSPDLADAFLATFAQGRHSLPDWEPINYDNRGIV